MEIIKTFDITHCRKCYLPDVTNYCSEICMYNYYLPIKNNTCFYCNMPSYGNFCSERCFQYLAENKHCHICMIMFKIGYRPDGSINNTNDFTVNNKRCINCKVPCSELKAYCSHKCFHDNEASCSGKCIRGDQLSSCINPSVIGEDEQSVTKKKQLVIEDKNQPVLASSVTETEQKKQPVLVPTVFEDYKRPVIASSVTVTVQKKQPALVSTVIEQKKENTVTVSYLNPLTWWNKPNSPVPIPITKKDDINNNWRIV